MDYQLYCNLSITEAVVDYGGLIEKSLKERFEKIGLQKVNEYYESNWEQAFDKAEQYK